MTMNHDNQAPGQDDFAAGGEEFVFAEERKPVNRNLLVLLLIAVVGGAAIYMMYLRSKGGSGDGDEATRAKAEQVAEFMKKGEEDLKKLDAVLSKMDQQTKGMVADASANQVPTDDLKTNPFQFDKPTDTPTQTGPSEVPMDPGQVAKAAAEKAEIQTIIYSAGGGSTVILNNKLCTEGAQVVIGGVRFTVKQIGSNFVTLQAGKAGEFKVMVKAKEL